MIQEPAGYPYPDRTTTEDWRESANCKSVGVGMFFDKRPNSYAAAKRVCAACPVKRECLETSMRNGDEFGIFGGLSPSERRRINTGRPLTPPVCAVPKCDRPHDARGYCARHYNIIVRNAS